MTTSEMPRTRWRGLLGEPLVHFFAAGGILFGAYWLFNKEPEAAVGGQRIEIGANDIRQMAVAWLAQGRAPLTRDELQSLVDQKIAEEVLFREGMALGLDRNDEIIKRRVAQKMDFLAADVASMQEPDKAELVEWFSKNSNRFMLPLEHAEWSILLTYAIAQYLIAAGCLVHVLDPEEIRRKALLNT